MNKPLTGDLHSYVAVLESLTPVTVDGIRYYPLTNRAPAAEPPVALLDDVDPGVVQIKETSNVSELLIHNDSDEHVLLLEGDIVEGGRQNRVINTTFVVKPRSTAPVPTSCVEQGRWGADKGAFTGSGSQVSPRVKSALKRSVTRSAVSTGHTSFASNQGDVWTTTSCELGLTQTDSRTSDHMALYRKLNEELEQKAEAVRAELQRPDVVGVLVTHGDGRAAIEAFATPRIAKKVIDRVVRAHLIAPPPDVTHREPAPLFDEIRTAESTEGPGHGGTGSEVRMERDAMSASAFLFGGSTVHLSADWESSAA